MKAFLIGWCMASTLIAGYFTAKYGQLRNERKLESCCDMVNCEYVAPYHEWVIYACERKLPGE